jgi:hypothetical protein
MLKLDVTNATPEKERRGRVNVHAQKEGTAFGPFSRPVTASPQTDLQRHYSAAGGGSGEWIRWAL